MENVLAKEEIEEIYKEIRMNPNYQKHAKLHHEYMKSSQFVKAAIEAKTMKDIEVMVFTELAKQRVNTIRVVKEKISLMSEEDRNFLNITSNALRMLSDLVEVFIMDANSILAKYDLNGIKEYDKLKVALAESKACVKTFDTLTNDDKITSLFGDCADNLYKMVFNKASSFVNKVKKYEEGINKKTSRNAKVA